MASKSKETEPEQATEAKPPKKGGSKLFIILALVIAVAAGGAGSFFYFQRVAKAKTETPKKSKHADDAEADAASDEDSDTGKDKSKRDDKEKKGDAKEKPDSPVAALPKDTDVKKVIEIQPFILNLADKDENRFLRLGLSLGIGEDGEEKPDSVFITRVRNAVLAVLMTKSSMEILTPEGKTALRKELLQAVRAVAKEPSVLAIYITELIVQR
jgi:flagellar protein FliL